MLERNRTLQFMAMLVVASLTLAIYANGLHGPFLLDDNPNLDTIHRWLQGRLNWRSAIDNRSGPLGRPVSMLTFLFDAARSGGMEPATFKTTNLCIHLLCGVLVFAFCRLLFRRIEAMRGIAITAALFIATWWLFLPLHVSTVLYVVQRMAQLGALFILLSLITYVIAREGIERGDKFIPQLLLWIVFPLITCIGVFAKENAVLAFPLALLIELVCFAPESDRRRPRSVVAFFILTQALPGLLIAGWLAFHPDLVTNGYRIRPFTFEQRVLTEPRVLWSYVKTTLFPVGEDMGLFHDTYVISTSLLCPWTTSMAITAWLLMVSMAVKVRRNHPLVTLGIGFFLVGHVLESSIFSLEIYFEHRNYLPDLGILLFILGIARALWLRRTTSTQIFLKTMKTVPILALATYAIATWIQADSWADADTLFEMQTEYNPASPRLQATLGARAVARGDTDTALAHIGLAEQFGPKREGMTSTFWRFLAYCDGSRPVPETLYVEFERRTNLPVTLDAMRYWEELAKRVESECPGLDARRLSDIGRRWLANDGAPPTEQTHWRSMYNLARIDAASGNLVLAESDARRAWIDSSQNNGIAVLLFQLNATLGRADECAVILAKMRQQADPGNADLTEAIELFSKALANGQIGRSAKQG